MRYWSNVFCIAMEPALTLPITGVLESTGCLSWRFLGPALTLPITGVLLLLLLLIIIILTATNIHSDCIYSSPYFVFLSIQQGVVYIIIMTPCFTSTWLYIRYNYYAIGLHAIPGLVDRRPSQPASGISASHTNPHKMLQHWMHSLDTLRIYTHSLVGTVPLMVRDRYGIAPGISMAQTNKNIGASCLC